MKARHFCCKFNNLHLCSLNQRLIIPKGPNNQNTVKKMILNEQVSSSNSSSRSSSSSVKVAAAAAAIFVFVATLFS